MTRISVAGVKIDMPTTCRTCRHGLVATIVDNEQAPASLRCDRCGAHRGRVSDVSRDFFSEIIRIYGMPTEAAAFRLGALSDAAMTRAATDDDN